MTLEIQKLGTNLFSQVRASQGTLLLFFSTALGMERRVLHQASALLLTQPQPSPLSQTLKSDPGTSGSVSFLLQSVVILFLDFYV